MAISTRRTVAKTTGQEDPPTETKSVDEWALKHGHLIKDGLDGRMAPDHIHGAASALHGWNLLQHQSDPSQRMQLTEADYLAALDALNNFNERRIQIPHAAALSPYLKIR